MQAVLTFLGRHAAPVTLCSFLTVVLLPQFDPTTPKGIVTIVGIVAFYSTIVPPAARQLSAWMAKRQMRRVINELGGDLKEFLRREYFETNESVRHLSILGGEASALESLGIISQVTVVTRASRSPTFAYAIQPLARLAILESPEILKWRGAKGDRTERRGEVV